ncbi:MAG: PAS domain S-box protein, partial [Chloroflexales bacterium]|nr:PAS domain S-box protein [Chloroflexales bacterium]
MSVASHAPPARLGEAEAPGLAFIDQAGHLVELNATLAALLGQPRDQLAGRLLAEVVSVWAPILTPIIKQVVATAAPALAVALPAQAAGTAPLAPLVANCYPVQTRCGYVAGVDLVVRQQDIHAPAPKRAADHQMELAGSVLPDRSLQEQQAQLLEQAYEPMLVWELPGRIIAWNRGAEELYGFTSAEALGQVSRELLRTVHPTDVPTFEATLQAAGQWQGELQHTTRDGRRLVVESRMTVVVGADGHARVLEANRDITARHQIEERLRWLQAVTASFAATQTLAQVRQVILDEIRTALGALRVGVRLVTPEALVVEGEVRGPPVAADVHRQASVVPLQTKHPAVETVQRGRPVFLCDAQAFVQRYPDWVEVMRHVPVGASAHLPLARGDEVFGVLTVSFAAPRTWDVGERAFAQALADRAAVAYERARLFDAERQAHERVERLQAVTAALSRAVTPPDVYAAVLQLGVGVMGAATADPALVAHSATFRIIDGDALTLASAIGIEEARLVPYQRIPLSAPLPVADAVRTRQPIWLRSQADYLQQYPHLEGQIRQLPTEAGTCLPLRVEDRVLGALTFTFAHPLTFDADQQGFLLTLADLAAQALERSRLYQAERAARHRLEETSAQLTAVLEAAPVGLLVAQAPGGEVLQRNHQVARIWRQDRSAATVNDVTSGFAGSHPDGRRLAPEEWPLARTLATGAAVADEEIRIVRGDGSPGAILVSSAPIRDSSGTVVAGVTVFADITARKTAEDAWRTSEERFRAFQETSVDGFALLESVRDAAGQIVDFRWRFVNAAAAQFQRKPMDWFFGRSVLTEMPNVRAEGRFDAYVRVVETGESWATELLYRGDGVERYTRLVAAKAGDGFALAFTDLSDRWRAEVQLRASEVRFRALVATIPQIIWTCAPDGRIDYVSEQWTDYTGLAPEQALQGDWQAAIHPDDWPATSEAWAHSLQTAAPVEVKHRLRHRSGEWRWQLVRSIPIRDAAGLLTHWVGTSTDIHASETRERHAQFLLALETELARLSEAAAIEQTTVDRLGVYLALSRCTFSHVEGEEVAVRHEWRHGAPRALSAHQFRNYLSSEAIAQLRAHRALVVEDTLADPRTAAATVTHRAQRTGAFVVIPIVAQGAWVGSLNLVNAQPRVWQVDEVQLVHEVAARVWPLLEQARAQAALRASEAQLQLLYAQ